MVKRVWKEENGLKYSYRYKNQERVEKRSGSLCIHWSGGSGSPDGLEYDDAGSNSVSLYWFCYIYALCVLLNSAILFGGNNGGRQHLKDFYIPLILDGFKLSFWENAILLSDLSSRYKNLQMVRLFTLVLAFLRFSDCIIIIIFFFI